MRIWVNEFQQGTLAITDRLDSIDDSAQTGNALLSELLRRRPDVPSIQFDPKAEDLRVEELVGRDEELEELDSWLSSPGGQYRVLTGGAYTGKSALVAELAINPPEDVDVVSFFIREVGARNTPEYFLDTVNDQLCRLLGKVREGAQDLDRRRTYFDGLWQEARQQARQKRRVLSLFVDGLDEQASVDVPISALLPSVDEWSKVLVSKRPNPRHLPGLDTAHPFRKAADSPYPLKDLPELEAAKQRAREDVERVLGEVRDGKKVLAFLALSNGHLSSSDLVHLVGDELTVDKALQKLKRHLLGSGTDEHGWELGHVELLRQTRRELDRAVIDESEARLDEWAQKYADEGWPEETPRYLLTSYWTMLARRGLVERLTSLVDEAYVYRLWQREGNWLAALSATESALNLLSRSVEPDVGLICSLGLRRAHLRGDIAEASDDLIVEYAASGVWHRVVGRTSLGRRGLRDHRTTSRTLFGDQPLFGARARSRGGR